jgi:hypothetical protein
MFRVSVLFFLLWALSGCAGTFAYAPPLPPPEAEGALVLRESKERVWKRLVPALGKRFFAVNAMDKDSGFVNLSYRGDPAAYADCGEIRSRVRNLAGEREYRFNSAKEKASFEIMGDKGLERLELRNELEGRVNLLVEETAKDETRVSAHAVYVLRRRIDADGAGFRFAAQVLGDMAEDAGVGKRNPLRQVVQGMAVQDVSYSFDDTIRFTSGETATFPGIRIGSVLHTASCAPTGALEREMIGRAKAEGPSPSRRAEG